MTAAPTNQQYKCNVTQHIDVFTKYNYHFGIRLQEINSSDRLVLARNMKESLLFRALTTHTHYVDSGVI